MLYPSLPSERPSDRSSHLQRVCCSFISPFSNPGVVFLWKSSALWSQQSERLKDGEINRLLGSEHLVGHGGYSVGVLNMGIFIFLPLSRPSLLLLSSTAGVGLRHTSSLSRVQQKQMMAPTKVKDLPGCSQGRASSGVRRPKLQPPCN